MIITIDGPAGSGKSTAARKLAARLEIAYLDTGAMYRAVAYETIRRRIDPEDGGAVLEVARSIDLQVDCGPTHTRVRIDEHDVSEAIRTMAVSKVTSNIAKNAAVRKLLVEQQRRVGGELRSFVTEGRDQGSVVFPNADIKFVLDASLEKRAERRFQELVADGDAVTLGEVADNLRARDGVDSKQWEPLLAEGRAVVIDTSHMTIPEVVDRMQECLSEARQNEGTK